MTQEQDYSRFAELMSDTAQLTVLQSGKSLGRVTLALFKELQKYPWEAVEEAVIRHREQEEFFPTLASIVKRIEGCADERALMAWTLVKKAERKYGLSYSFRFPTPAIQFAIEALGGWRKLYYKLSGSEERFIEHDFSRLHALAEQRGVTWADVETLYFKGDLERTARSLNAKERELPPIHDVLTGQPIKALSGAA